MPPTTLHKYFKFDYGVIAEKPRVGHLPRFFPVHPVGKNYALDRK